MKQQRQSPWHLFVGMCPDDLSVRESVSGCGSAEKHPWSRSSSKPTRIVSGSAAIRRADPASQLSQNLRKHGRVGHGGHSIPGWQWRGLGPTRHEIRICNRRIAQRELDISGNRWKLQHNAVGLGPVHLNVAPVALLQVVALREHFDLYIFWMILPSNYSRSLSAYWCILHIVVVDLCSNCKQKGPISKQAARHRVQDSRLQATVAEKEAFAAHPQLWGALVPEKASNDVRCQKIQKTEPGDVTDEALIGLKLLQGLVHLLVQGFEQRVQADLQKQISSSSKQREIASLPRSPSMRLVMPLTFSAMTTGGETICSASCFLLSSAIGA